ncbi:hypothetical protein ACTWP5_22510 [Streptomyces sp. 4N509B]|uniref:hypothetical protein n=1 Tax=Streptomyces sp. 4N509B TaxID=3457413 RepID=UPI003FD4EA1F
MTDSEISRRIVVLGASSLAGVALAGQGAAHASPLPTTPDAGGSPTGGDEPYELARGTIARAHPLDDALVRTDLREGRPGVPLALRLRVQDSGSRRASVVGAVVELWSCDATGRYATGRESHLRGAQVANGAGLVAFTTIVPGWRPGRAPHVHVVVHGEDTIHAGQLFLDDAVVAEAHRHRAYADRPGRPVALADDPVYGGGGARDGLVTVERASGGRAAGYVGGLTLAVAR